MRCKCFTDMLTVGDVCVVNCVASSVVCFPRVVFCL